MLAMMLWRWRLGSRGLIFSVYAAVWDMGYIRDARGGRKCTHSVCNSLSGCVEEAGDSTLLHWEIDALGPFCGTGVLSFV